MDKITLHVIQMGSNPRSLNSRVLDTRALDSKVSDSKVSKASDTWVLEVSDMGLEGLESESLVSDPSISDSRRGLGGSRLETFSSSDLNGLLLGPVNHWACARSIYDPTRANKHKRLFNIRGKKTLKN
jgi:hypothetical protein